MLQAPKIQAGRSHTNGTTAPASALQHLTSASSGPHELFARVSDWARLHGGGRAVKIASGPSETSMVIRCRCADCPFTVKCRAQRDAGNWTVNVDNSVWSHGEATWKCCSKQHVDVHVCSQLPSVTTTVLQKPTADAWDTAELAKWMANSGFAEPKPKSQQGRTRVYRKLINKIFGDTEQSRKADLLLLLSWRDAFNTGNAGRNGHCTVGYHAAPATASATSAATGAASSAGSTATTSDNSAATTAASSAGRTTTTGDNSAATLKYVNIVFGISARAFSKITIRMLDIDAAHLEKTRTDWRYIIVEMHTCNNTIVGRARIFHIPIWPSLCGGIYLDTAT